MVTPWYLQVIGNFSYFVPSDHELLILNRYDGLKNTFDSSPEKKKKKMQKKRLNHDRIQILKPINFERADLNLSELTKWTKIDYILYINR